MEEDFEEFDQSELFNFDEESPFESAVSIEEKNEILREAILHTVSGMIIIMRRQSKLEERMSFLETLMVGTQE